MATVIDPTGYKFSIVERERRDPLSLVMLRVGDMNKSIEFYKTMGMSVLRTLENAEQKYSLAFLGFGSEEDSTALELRYDWDGGSFTAGNGYAQIAVSVPDVYDAAKIFENAGVAITRAPGPLPGFGTKICAVRDPDGWKTVMVDAADFDIDINR